jgi:hypothetical protein
MFDVLDESDWVYHITIGLNLLKDGFKSEKIDLVSWSSTSRR